MITTILLGSIVGLLLLGGAAGYYLACVQVDLGTLRRTRTTARHGLQEAATMVRMGRNTLDVVEFLDAAVAASRMAADELAP
jgi:hypothetical protein